MDNPFESVKGGKAFVFPIDRNALDEGTKKLIDDIFGKHFPKDADSEKKEPDYSPYGGVVEEWSSVPHTVRAIQYRPNNAAAVMDFMHKNSVVFGSYNHGHLIFLQPDEEEIMEFGQWVVIRDYPDGTSEPGLFDDEDFRLEYVHGNLFSSEESEESESEPVSKTAYFKGDDEYDEFGVHHAYSSGDEE